MDTYSLTLAEKKDASVILNFYHSLTESPGCTWNSDYPNKDNITRDISMNSLYLLKDGNDIISVATATVSRKQQVLEGVTYNPCYIKRFGVARPMQRQRIGTLMLEKIVEFIRNNGFEEIRLLVGKNNVPAIAFYEKNGFTRCGVVNKYNKDFFCYKKDF